MCACLVASYFACILYLDLGGFEGLMDAEMLIFNKLQTFHFHNHFALAIS